MEAGERVNGGVRSMAGVDSRGYKARKEVQERTSPSNRRFLYDRIAVKPVRVGLQLSGANRMRLLVRWDKAV